MIPGYSRTGANRPAATGGAGTTMHHPANAQPGELQGHCRAPWLKCLALRNGPWCGHYGARMALDSETGAPLRHAACVADSPLVSREPQVRRIRPARIPKLVSAKSLIVPRCKARNLTCEHLEMKGRYHKCVWHGDSLKFDKDNDAPLKCRDCLAAELLNERDLLRRKLDYLLRPRKQSEEPCPYAGHAQVLVAYSEYPDCWWGSTASDATDAATWRPVDLEHFSDP
jgi:hypothetical protein